MATVFLQVPILQREKLRVRTCTLPGFCQGEGIEMGRLEGKVPLRATSGLLPPKSPHLLIAIVSRARPDRGGKEALESETRSSMWGLTDQMRLS